MIMTWSLGETTGSTSVKIRADDLPPESHLRTMSVGLLLL